jgi:thiaminase/transcriptional activator TenA
MADSYSEGLWEEAEPIWRGISQHPFLMAVKGGTLPEEKFRYYIIQDYLYLEAFARSVALALAKAPDATTMASLSKRIATPTERPYHRKLMPLLGISQAEVEKTVPSPTNLAYSNHILRVAALEPLGPTAAALLPCPWTYHELGPVLGFVEHPVYGPWCSIYAEGFLEESVKTWRMVVDRMASQASAGELASMRSAFLTSIRYELMFWDMAYKEESWGI